MKALGVLLSIMQHPLAEVVKDTVVFISKHPTVHEMLKPEPPSTEDVASTANSFAVDDVPFKEV